MSKSLSSFSIRGRVLEGRVISTSMTNVVKIEFRRFRRNSTLKKGYRSRHSLLAYLPQDFSGVQVDDVVRVGEIRKRAKNVSFVVYSRVPGVQSSE